MKFLINLFILACIILIYSNISYAHLCDDVFIQAKDNLAVKVDVRDGQLRISKRGKFRVYLLNTMDREIANINLKVITNDFNAKVSKGKSWANFPALSRFEKQYFEVTLMRKKDVAVGKYKIGLKLINGRDSSMVFKTVNLNDAMDTIFLPYRKTKITIDGKINKQEWSKSSLCTSLYEYRRTSASSAYLSSHNKNYNARVQTRFRFIYDRTFLYCLLDFKRKGKKDVATLHFANNYNSKPKQIKIDLQNKKIYSNINNFSADIKFNGQKAEIRIPLNKISTNKKSFYINLTRIHNGETSYWRGNRNSLTDPVVYGKFVLK